jgi:hypothetical protein
MHVDPRRRTVQLRKRPADGPGKFQAGVYDVDCRVPGSGGLVPPRCGQPHRQRQGRHHLLAVGGH